MAGADQSSIQVSLQEGLTAHQAGRLQEAETSYQDVLRLRPDHFDALHLTGLVCAQTGRLARAVALISRAIQINPDFTLAYGNLGKILNDLGRHEDAIASCDRAIALDADGAAAYVNRGNALDALHQGEAAIASYDRAIALAPRLAETYNDRGNTLQKLRRYDAALADYAAAIALRPNYPEAFIGRGVVLHRLQRPLQALASYRAAISLNPSIADAYSNMGNLLDELKRYDEAASAFAKAVALKPTAGFVHGTWLHTKMKICDWRGLDAQFVSLMDHIRAGARVAPPFSLLSMPASAELQRDAAIIWATAMRPAAPVSPSRRRKGKIRLAYFSADFHNHATAWLMAGLFEMHDRSRFEVTGFSFGRTRGDDMYKRVSHSFDDFIDVDVESDDAISRLSREKNIDIAIDLKGYTTHCRTGIFLNRAAPLQVNYLGFPGTMGTGSIDYIIADDIVIPEASRGFYTEQVAYLPGCYQVNDSKRRVSDRRFTRRECNLPERGFVFCSFNNNYKITPKVFDRWMNILKRVDHSVLWILGDNHWAIDNLIREAEARGVTRERLVFAERMNVEEHLARQSLADLFLDSWPCNAHTTASDALWVGLPVLTLLGETFAGRVAASLLTAMGASDLIANTPTAYEDLAVSLARDPARIEQLKKKLRRNRKSSTLFDTKRSTAHIEAAFSAMHERCLAGLPPALIRL